jgi:hypothetical protein
MTIRASIVQTLTSQILRRQALSEQALPEQAWSNQVLSNQVLPRLLAALAFCSLGLTLSGCADMSDGVSTAFADPAKYELYDCKQLEAERKNLANRSAELQGLMEKAKTGVGGSVVAELAYRNDYVAVRGQSKFADQAWQKNKCRETPQQLTPAAESPDAIKAKLKSKAKSKSASGGAKS